MSDLFEKEAGIPKHLDEEVRKEIFAMGIVPPKFLTREILAARRHLYRCMDRDAARVIEMQGYKQMVALAREATEAAEAEYKMMVHKRKGEEESYSVSREV